MHKSGGTGKTLPGSTHLSPEDQQQANLVYSSANFRDADQPRVYQYNPSEQVIIVLFDKIICALLLAFHIY